jgi:dTDP-4-amino-4,6-dideoxygalactose transaminase
METAYSDALRTAQGPFVPFRSIQPANRLETSNWELLSASLRFSSRDSLAELTRVLRKLTARQHVYFAPSCRAALAQILSSLPQEEVVIPAMTCPVVGEAARLAHKKLIFVDSAPGQVNSTSAQFAKQARPGRILIPTHLFGIPTDAEEIARIGKAHGCVTIEDAAAALGGQYHGSPLGTFADFGVFSFERSKRFPAFRGAVIVVNNDSVVDREALSRKWMFPEQHDLPLREFVFALAYNIATTPWIYGRFVLPRLLQRYAAGNPETSSVEEPAPGTDPFYVQQFHPLQAELVLRMLHRMGSVREHIRKLVSIYTETLRGSPVTTFLPEDCDHAGLLRFPIALGAMERPRFLRHALKRGVFLETNYEQLLAPPDNLVEFPNALALARSMVLLPLYTGLRPSRARLLGQSVAAIANSTQSEPYTLEMPC